MSSGMNVDVLCLDVYLFIDPKYYYMVSHFCHIIYLSVLACTFLELMFSLFKVVVYTLSWTTCAGMNPSETASLSCMSHSTCVCVQACYCSVEVIVALFSHVQDWLLKPHFIPRPFLVFFFFKHWVCFPR